MGAIATTRLSDAPVSQVVHPRLEAPETTKRLISDAKFCLGKFLSSIHGTNCTFYHREKQWPGIVAVFFELMQGIGDQCIFRELSIEWLIRRLTQQCHNAFIFCCNTAQGPGEVYRPFHSNWEDLFYCFHQ